MKTTIGIFLSSMFFGAAISVAYWFASHEPTGTILLGIMATGFLFAASYTTIAERDAHIPGDEQYTQSGKGTGERIGLFITRSNGPILCALGLAAFLIGAVLLPWIAAIGAALFFFGIARMIGESNL